MMMKRVAPQGISDEHGDGVKIEDIRIRGANVGECERRPYERSDRRPRGLRRRRQWARADCCTGEVTSIQRHPESLCADCPGTSGTFSPTTRSVIRPRLWNRDDLLGAARPRVRQRASSTPTGAEPFRYREVAQSPDAFGVPAFQSRLKTYAPGRRGDRRIAPPCHRDLYAARRRAFEQRLDGSGVSCPSGVTSRKSSASSSATSCLPSSGGSSARDPFRSSSFPSSCRSSSARRRSPLRSREHPVVVDLRRDRLGQEHAASQDSVSSSGAAWTGSSGTPSRVASPPARSRHASRASFMRRSEGPSATRFASATTWDRIRTSS